MINFRNIFKREIRKIPKKNSVISDLFIWRNNEDWQTKFELMNFKPFFDKNNKKKESIIVEIRDKNGSNLTSSIFTIESMQKKTIDISELLYDKKINHDHGTFSVYHEHIPIINQFEAFIAERGYSLFKYKNLKTFSSVHGNLDAISFLDQKKQFLGKQTILSKNFNIQFKFENRNYYDLFFVNPTNKNLKIKIFFIRSNNNLSETITIAPGGSEFVNLKEGHNIKRIFVRSKYLMSRPLVFEYNENFINSFHA